MKINFSVFVLFPFILLFAGCAGQLRPLGYLAIEPYAKPFQKKVGQPLHVVLMEDVKDALAVEGGGIKKMVVSDFRRTVRDGLNATFRKNFETVIFPEKNPEKGLVLVIYRIKPFWKVGGASTTAILAANVAIPVTINNSAAAFQFESSLFLENKKNTGRRQSVVQ